MRLRSHRNVALDALLLACLVALAGLTSRRLATAIETQHNAVPAHTADTNQALVKWRGQRFGLFIHWGPVTLRGAEISWSRDASIPADEYDSLFQRFNPAQFDANEWVRVATSAGMKYVVLTTKHHDGFCLWPTAAADYHIGNTPFRRDVLGELVTACREQGLPLSAYYSLSDWRGPDYGALSPGGRVINPQPNMPRHFALVKYQTQELLTTYGPLESLWFDGEWEEPWTAAYGNELYANLKHIQPSLLINNRVSKDRTVARRPGDARGTGDYLTPEQRVGGFDRVHPWESCMTLCTQWSWKPNDRPKSLEECVQTLIQTVGGDGNFLLNVGPSSAGQIEPRQVERLQEIGAWLAKYGAGIYGTRGGPFRPGAWGAATCKEDRIYLFITQWPDSGPLCLPAIGTEILGHRTLSGGRARVEATPDGIEIHMPRTERDSLASVIELTIRGDAYAIDPRGVTLHRGLLTFDRTAAASSVRAGKPEYLMAGQTDYGAACAVDDNRETRWAAEASTKAVQLEIDLGAHAMIERLTLEEPADERRIQAFEVEGFDGRQWSVIVGGTDVGPHWSQAVTPVVATRIRLNILDASGAPEIVEFQAWGWPISTSPAP